MNAFEIGKKLAPLYKSRAKLEFQKSALERQIAERRALLTFIGEVDGKDADARKLARSVKQDEIYRSDSELSTWTKALLDLEFKLAENRGEIEALEAERRALEWSIRLQLAAAIEGKGVQPNGRGDPVSDSRVFDDAMDYQVTDDLPF